MAHVHVDHGNRDLLINITRLICYTTKMSSIISLVSLTAHNVDTIATEYIHKRLSWKIASAANYSVLWALLGTHLLPIQGWRLTFIQHVKIPNNCSSNQMEAMFNREKCLIISS